MPVGHTIAYLLGGDTPHMPATWRGGWNDTTGMGGGNDNLLDPLKDGAVNQNRSRPEASAITPFSVALSRHIDSRPLAEQTISGTLDVIIGIQESNADAQFFWKIYAYVTDGQTGNVRGVLLDYEDDTVEWPTTSVNGTPTGTALPSPQTLSSVDVQDGDFRVIEIGYISRNSHTTSRTGSMRVGGMTDTSALTAQGDLTVGSIDTTNLIGSIIFSNPVYHLDPPLNDSYGLRFILTGTEGGGAPFYESLWPCARSGEEPLTSCNPTSANGHYCSRWWEWTCPLSQNATVTADIINAGTTFITNLVVLTGAPGSFVEVDCRKNNDPSFESITWAATIGVIYTIMVGTEFYVMGGDLAFTFTPDVEPPPAETIIILTMFGPDGPELPFTNHTAMGWVNLIAASDTERHFYYVGMGESPFVPGEPYIWIGTAVDGITLTLNIYNGTTVFEYAGPVLILNRYYHWVYVKIGDTHSVYLSTEGGSPTNAVLAIGPISQASNVDVPVSAFVYARAEKAIPKAFKVWSENLSVAEIKVERETYRAVRHADIFNVTQFRTDPYGPGSGGWTDYSGFDRRLGGVIFGGGTEWEVIRGPRLGILPSRPWFDNFESYLSGFPVPKPFTGVVDPAAYYEYPTQPIFYAYINTDEGLNASQAFDTRQAGCTIWFEHDGYTGRCGYVSAWSYKRSDAQTDLRHGVGASVHYEPEALVASTFGFGNQPEAHGLTEPEEALVFSNTYPGPTFTEVVQDIYVMDVWQFFEMFWILSTVTLDGLDVNADGSVVIKLNSLIIYEKTDMQLTSTDIGWPTKLNTWNSIGLSWGGLIDDLTIKTTCYNTPVIGKFAWVRTGRRIP